MRRLRVAAIAIAAVVALALAVGWGLLGTTPGARFVLARVLPDGASVGGVDGRLWGPLVLEDVRFESPRLALSVARVRVEWRPARLLRRTVDVTALEVDTVTARLRDAGPEAEDAAPAVMTRPSVPIALSIGRVRVRDVRVIPVGGADTVTLAALDGAFRARADTLAVELRWRGELADGRAVAGDGALFGGAGRYRLDHRLTAPVAATLAATVEDAWALERLGWSLELEVPRVALSAVDSTLPGELEAVVSASGDTASAVATVRARGAHADVGPMALEARVAYRDRAVTVDTMALSREGGPGTLWGGGRVAFASGGGDPAGELRLTWRDLGWPLDSAAVSSPRGRLRAAGSLRDFTTSLALAIERPDGPLGAWTLDGQGSYGDTLTARFRWTGALPDVPRLDGSAQVRYAAESTEVAVRVSGSGVAEGAPAVEFEGAALYRLAERTLRVDTVSVALPETGGRLAGRAEAALGGSSPRIAGRVQWHDLGWPFHDPAYWSDEGSAVAETETGELRLELDAHLAGIGLPETRWALTGHGDPAARFVVDSVRGRLLGGEIWGAGVVRADSGASWDVTLRGDRLDPGVWRAEWPGRLSFRLAAAGRLDAAAAEYSVRLDTLGGALRDRPVSARVVAAGVGAHVRLDTLWLRSAGSTIEATGTVGESLDLGWRVAAESLSDLVPNAAGRLTAEGRATGTRDRPAVALTAEGRSLAAAGWTVARLNAEGDVDTGGAHSTLALRLVGVTGPSVALDSLAVDGVGSRGRHELELAAAAPADVLRARLAGGFDDGVWTGRLETLALRSNVAGDWRLRSPAALTVARDSGSVSELCWVGSGELCLNGAWDPTGARWQGTGTALPMAFLRPALPPSLAIHGEFGLETLGRAEPGSVPRGVFRLTGGPGEIEYTRDVGRTVAQPYDGFVGFVSSDAYGVDATVDLRLGELGSLEAEARLPGTGPIAERRIEGTFLARLEDDGTAARFVPALAESRAVATADLAFGGTVAAPDVRGRVALTGLETTVAPAGIRLRDGELVATRADSARWRLAGGVRSDTGRLDLAGTLRLPTPDSTWRVDLSVTGRRFRAFQTPELLVAASPDLTVRVSPDSVRVDGDVRVPRARIALRRLESAVRPSPDVVIVGAADAPTPDSTVTPAAVRADVRLTLGDSVTLDALGVTGRLEGQLGVLAEPMRPPVGSGELGILDGSYRIYRQTFQIDRGRILYAATPLTDPALDLRITRSRNGVLAGMEVAGRATDPRVRLFSEPALSDDEILAYLVVGRPLRRLSQSEGSQVQNVAESIGVAGGNLLLARLNSIFGLDRARLERTTVTQGEIARRETSLVLGSQILPRVQLDYVIGLTGAANVLRLRYAITDQWTLQTETGEETGADLLYSIEW